VPFLTKILQEITIKWNLRNDWKRTRNLAVKSMPNAQITYVRNLPKEHHQSAWDKFINTLNFQDRSFYKLDRHLLHKKPAIATLKSIIGKKFYDTKSKIELFSDTMKEQFTPYLGTYRNQSFNLHSIAELNRRTTKSNLLTFSKEVCEIIKYLPSAKVPRCNNIVNAALKHLPAPTTLLG